MKMLLVMLAVYAVVVLFVVWLVRYKIDKGKTGWR